MIAAIAGAAVVVLALVFLLSSGGSEQDEQADPPRGAEASANEAEAAPARSTPAPSLSGGRVRPGSDPKKPAPAIETQNLAKAEEHFLRAKELWNDGQRLRARGDDAWTGKVTEAFEEMSQSRELLGTYTDWLEEADMEGWRVPAEYDALQRVLDRHDPLYQKIKKVKQM